jgi:hypothetical protein
VPVCLGGDRCRGTSDLIHSMRNRKSTNVTIPLPPDVLAWLDDEAARKMMPRAQLVRAWITREMEGQTLERLGRLNEAIQELRMALKQQAKAIEEMRLETIRRVE